MVASHGCPPFRGYLHTRIYMRSSILPLSLPFWPLTIGSNCTLEAEFDVLKSLQKRGDLLVRE